MTATSQDRKIVPSRDSSPPCLCLSLHAGFFCQRSGACCTSGWPIHVEADRVQALREAVGAGRLTFTSDEATDSPFLQPAHLPPGAGAVLRTRASGACAFYERRLGICAIQRTLGHDALPSACQHFPRRVLIEPDRTLVSLSHYCPTVAGMAFHSDARLEVVEAPASLSDHIALEGLDALEALPPLLRPDMLTDLEGYRAWERVVIDILAEPGTPEAALADIRRLTEGVRNWTPREGNLRETVEAARVSRLAPGKEDAGSRSLNAGLAADYEAARASVPAGIATTPAPDRLDTVDARLVADAWPRFSPPLRRFLAAHAFGNWCAYYGMGLRTVVRSLEVALAVVRVEAARLCADTERPLDEALLIEAIRAADLLLVHLADPKMLATQLSAVEQER